MGKRGGKLQAEVLDLLRARRVPLSAYDVLDTLKNDARPLAPTTIYRALAALVEAGKVHRLESRNAFVACQRHRDNHAAILSICDGCGVVEEMVSKDVLNALTDATGEAGFTASRHVIEVIGQCASCGPTEDQR